MVYSEQQYKILEEKIKKLEKENELKDKDNKLLKKQLREKDEVIWSHYGAGMRKNAYFVSSSLI